MIMRNIMFFYSLSKNTFLNLSVFRANFFTTLISDFILLVISLVLWDALYDSALVSPAQSYAEVVTYLLLARIAVSIDMDFVHHLQNRVLSGDIASELIKPISLSKFLLAQEVGNYLTRLLFRGLPIVFIISICYRIPFPAFSYGILFLLSLVLSFLLMYYINFITGIAAFWIVHLFSLNVLKGQLVRFLSGAFIPLWFFPQGVQHILYYLPFASVVYVPVQIFLEREIHSVALGFIALQCFWIVVLMIASRWIWRKATNQLVINGG